MIIAAGIFDVIFAVFHLTFETTFGWKRDLAHLRPVNAAIMRVMNLCLAWLFLLSGWVLVKHAGEVMSTELGRCLLAGLSILWWSRMVEQPIFFGLRWASNAFTAVFLLGALLHTLAFFS